MKKVKRALLEMFAIVAVSTSCSDEKVAVAGEGKVKLSMTVSDEVTVLGRSISNEELTSLQESCKIYVYSSKGLIRKYKGIDEVPSELWLVSGDY